MKGSAACGIALALEEEMLQFAAEPAQVEHPVGPLHALQVDGHDGAALAEQKVRRGDVAVDQHAPVFPHAALVAPGLAQVVEFIGVVVPHASL